MNTLYDVIVIGAGIAGLTAAALLQHDGARVLLLEAHDKPGGCAGYFAAGKWQFPVGATVAMGFETGGLHRRIFDYLNITDYHADLLPALKILLPDRNTTLWHDPKRWQQERALLPGHRARQELFWRLQETIADAGWGTLSRLPSLPLQNQHDLVCAIKLIHPDLLKLGPFLPSTVGHVLRVLKLTHDREFMALLNLLLIITVQQEADNAPMTNSCAGIDLFRHGAFHLHGGIGTIARLLLQSFERDGGTLHLNTEVQCVQPHYGNNARVSQFMIASTQDEFHATRVIANVPLANVPRLVALPESTQRCIQRYEQRGEEQWGAVNLYIALRDAALSADAPLNIQVLNRYRARPGDGEDVFLSLSAQGDTVQAPMGWRTLNVSTHTRLQEWENLSPDEYRQKKREWRERMLVGVRRAIPDFEANRKFIIVGTPRTWQDYTKRHRGGVGGSPLTLRNSNLLATPQRLGLDNFWLVGDTTFPGQGTVACALSGLNAWRDITGKRTLSNQRALK